MPKLTEEQRNELAEYKFINNMIRGNTLNDAGAFILWEPGNAWGADLDGSFTLDELEEIVAFMKANQPIPGEVLWIGRPDGLSASIDGKHLGVVRFSKDIGKWIAWHGSAKCPCDTLEEAKKFCIGTPKMTEEQRNELAELVIKKISAKWGDEFTDKHTDRIYVFCKDEVEDIAYPFDNNDVHCAAIEFDLKYG